MKGHSPSSLPSLLAVAGAALVVGAGLAVPAPAAANPSLEWHELYDGGSQQSDTGLKALTDPAGNLVVAGEVTDAASNGNLLVRKLARGTGALIWSHSVVGTSDNRMAMGDMVWDGAGDLLIGGTRLGCYG